MRRQELCSLFCSIKLCALVARSLWPQVKGSFDLALFMQVYLKYAMKVQSLQTGIFGISILLEYVSMKLQAHCVCTLAKVYVVVEYI